MKTFKGTIHVDDKNISLEAGGVIVEVKGKKDQFDPLNGTFTVISGRQEGSTILDAVPIATPEASASPELLKMERVIAAIQANMDSLNSIPGVFGVRPGYSNDADEDAKPVIVVLSKQGETPEGIPSSIEGIKVEQQMASVQEITQGLLPLADWAGTLAFPEAAPTINYVPPPESLVTLDIKHVSNITCHVGPDAGWKTLKPFLEGTKETLTVAMYEFYAEHIIDTITELGQQSDAQLDIILQVDSNDKEIKAILSQSWKERVKLVKASVSGPKRIFNNSYHTKVAVRDSKAMWLSSGNWSPNSQPLIKNSDDKFIYNKGNREWHVIIEDESISLMYEKFIKYDMAEAEKVGLPESAIIYPDLLIPASALVQPEAALIQDRPFEPKSFATNGSQIKVKPLMSPDNYATEVLKLIQGAKHSLYLQFSYIRQPSKEVFDDIITAIAGKMKEGLDVRVLVSSNQNEEHSLKLIKRGFKRSMFRRQRGKMHNKGILVDGKIAAVGSNNWSSDGTQYNRDTTLLFYSSQITKYYTEVFLFDWNNLWSPITSQPEVMPLLAPANEPTPLGMVRIPWQAWFGDND